ncbi:gliding motility protein GldM [Bacteroidales bacterium OttesenSCG-928-K03]|nr:gliding motility protein GldM [Odoribacter sp. OttesenSCG-928-L07]MDL2238927.1 gliding motility protein GldM [Bacteroidales bacterium OttesenSCG-928-L14]MDL2242905.1 gliding motility protein GldM [Bacteroidales bacterium OttesenSCG-928-K03]
MAGYKETPRQKMIGMMYLVLTAMLALNVSVELLNAFVMVNDSVVETNQTMQGRIDETYAKFNEQYLLNQSKVEPYWEKAKEIRTLSTNMINYIDSIKFTAIALSEGKTVEEIKDIPLGQITSKDNYDVATNYFIGQDLAKGEAEVLKEKLNEFVSDVLALVPEERRDYFDLGISTDGDYYDASGKKLSWERYHFYHTILAADITFLNKLIMDVQNAEYELVNYFARSVSADDFKFDKIAVKLIPKSNYIFLNDTYEAEVLVVAYDTVSSPDVKVLMGTDKITDANMKNARTVTGKDGEGSVKITFPAQSEGIQHFAGIVSIMSPSGELNHYHFNDQFIVARPSITVAATKMNVFYIGVDNPVAISAAGYGNSQITPTISVGTLTRTGDGMWNVKIPAGAKGTTKINVTADTDKGKIPLGSREYRIKRVPNPSATIANQFSGKIDKNILSAAGAVIPKMPEDFEFDLTFQITSFEFIGSQGGGDLVRYVANSGNLTQEMKNFIQNSKRGNKIWIENIVAKGPDGDRTLSNISLEIR